MQGATLHRNPFYSRLQCHAPFTPLALKHKNWTWTSSLLKTSNFNFNLLLYISRCMIVVVVPPRWSSSSYFSNLICINTQWHCDCDDSGTVMQIIKLRNYNIDHRILYEADSRLLIYLFRLLINRSRWILFKIYQTDNPIYKYIYKRSFFKIYSHSRKIYHQIVNYVWKFLISL